MIWTDEGGIRMEWHEPAEFVCAECDPLERFMGDSAILHKCLQCNRYYLYGRFLDEFADEGAFERWLRANGMSPGMSSMDAIAGPAMETMGVTNGE